MQRRRRICAAGGVLTRTTTHVKANLQRGSNDAEQKCRKNRKVATHISCGIGVWAISSETIWNTCDISCRLLLQVGHVYDVCVSIFTHSWCRMWPHGGTKRFIVESYRYLTFCSPHNHSKTKSGFADSFTCYHRGGAMSDRSDKMALPIWGR